MYAMSEEDLFWMDDADMEALRLAVVNRLNLVDLLWFDLPMNHDEFGNELAVVEAVPLLHWKYGLFRVGQAVAGYGYVEPHVPNQRRARFWSLVNLLYLMHGDQCGVLLLDVSTPWLDRREAAPTDESLPF